MTSEHRRIIIPSFALEIGIRAPSPGGSPSPPPPPPPSPPSPGGEVPPSLIGWDARMGSAIVLPLMPYGLPRDPASATGQSTLTRPARRGKIRVPFLDWR